MSNYISNGPEDKPEAVDGLADKAKGCIHDFFGCSPNLEQNKNPYSNESDFLIRIVRVRTLWWGLINQVLLAYKEDIEEKLQRRICEE